MDNKIEKLLNIEFEEMPFKHSDVLISKNIYGQFTVCLEDAWVLSDDEESMSTYCGTGATLEEALDNYINYIAGKTLIIEDELDENKEYKAFVS